MEPLCVLLNFMVPKFINDNGDRFCTWATETFQQIVLVDSEGGFCDDCGDKSDNFK